MSLWRRTVQLLESILSSGPGESAARQNKRLGYTDQQLEKHLDDLEADFLERKEAWTGSAPETGRQAVCSFANDLPDHKVPGVLFVGVNNGGVPVGLEISDELLRILADIKTDGDRKSVV